MDRPGQVLRTALLGGAVLVGAGSLAGLSLAGLALGVAVAVVDLLLLALSVRFLLRPGGGFGRGLLGLLRLGVAGLLLVGALAQASAPAVLVGLTVVPVSLSGRVLWTGLVDRALAREAA